jgi:uroporphyrinogen-III synthase
VIRVAITRALPEAMNTAEAVRARGAEPVLAPLLSIEPRTFNIDTTGAQALLFTSTNGAREFAAASPARDLPVLTVGDATAAAARAAGFTDVRSADGDATALVQLVIRSLDRGGGKLIHIAGVQVAGDVVGALVQAGFVAERRAAYEARPADTLPAAFNEHLDIVLFHSARGAETFVKLGAPGAAQLTAACFSAAVAAVAERAPWRRIIVAPAPREDALLAAALGGLNSPAGASA